MTIETAPHRGRLHRLQPNAYRGCSAVHWSMTIEKRATGWLDCEHHLKLRELLCHALARHGLPCPAYCLMPDHAHFLWLGLGESSDHMKAASLFRAAWNGELFSRGRRLQRQAHDHVLRENERQQGAFEGLTYYIFNNPVRAELVQDWRRYPFLGSIVPGYPRLDPRTEGFTDRYWHIHRQLAERYR